MGSVGYMIVGMTFLCPSLNWI